MNREGKKLLQIAQSVATEAEMLALGQKVAQAISVPAVIELVGDVGAGKTTFTRGFASGLGIADPVTSPSFTISKRYAFSRKNNSAEKSDNNSHELIHYDFYRLPDPGIMQDELAENISSLNNIIIIEWGESVSGLLPENTLHINISLNPDGTRTVNFIGENL